MLRNETYADLNTQINRVVYSQLAISTVRGTTHHPIKQHEDDKNVYGA